MVKDIDLLFSDDSNSLSLLWKDTLMEVINIQLKLVILQFWVWMVMNNFSA